MSAQPDPVPQGGGGGWWSPAAAEPWREAGPARPAAPPGGAAADLPVPPGNSAGLPSWGTGPPAPAAPALSAPGTLTGRPRRRFVALVAAVALLAATVGGVIGAALAGGDNAVGRVVDLGPVVGRAPTATAPGSIAAIASKVLPSVVSINVRSGDSADTGSGVVLSSDGYILTNNHVVSGTPSSIQVVFYAKKTTPAKIVGSDAQSDLAVLKAQGVSGLQRADLGSSSSLRVGDPVVAIGSPLGLTGTVTAGIVSAKDRPVPTGGDGAEAASTVLDAIQTDAAINPGNSGGALVNGAGAVVGINTAIATVSGSTLGGGQGGNIGVGFAIPIDQARSIAAELIATGRATHPVIGVRAQSVDADLARGLPGGRPGALVVAVTAGSGAARAGLAKDDLLTAVDGRPIASVDELIVAVRKHKAGETARVTFVRKGQSRTVAVRLGDDAG